MVVMTVASSMILEGLSIEWESSPAHM